MNTATFNNSKAIGMTVFRNGKFALHTRQPKTRKIRSRLKKYCGEILKNIFPINLNINNRANRRKRIFATLQNQQTTNNKPIEKTQNVRYFTKTRSIRRMG
jgi:hypothetical protein